MEPGDKIMTIEYRALYTFTNSNYGNIYSKKPFIEVHKECKDFSKIIKLEKQIILMPENYELNITKNKPKIIELIEEDHTKNKIIFEKGRLIKRSQSFNTNKYLERTNNMKIEGEYFNGKENIKGANILIDTGASECHIAANKNKGLIAYKTKPYKYINFDGEEHISEYEVKVLIQIGGINLLFHVI